MPLRKARRPTGVPPRFVPAVDGLIGALLTMAGRGCPVWHYMGHKSVMRLEVREVNGVLTDDERRIVGAAQQLGLILSSDWPDVAAHLLAQGADGEAVSELAGLSRAASPWSVDQLVPKLLAELAIRETPAEQASDVVARSLGLVAGTRPQVDEFAAIRFLARLAPDLDYPGPPCQRCLLRLGMAGLRVSCQLIRTRHSARFGEHPAHE